MSGGKKPGPFMSFRYNLAYSRLYSLVTKASSKPHSALTRPLGSRFTEASVTRYRIGPSYVPSTRVYRLRGTPGDLDVDCRVQIAVHSQAAILARVCPLG